MKPAEKVPSPKVLMPLKLDHALLDPGQLSETAEETALDLMAEGESDNTRLAESAMEHRLQKCRSICHVTSAC